MKKTQSTIIINQLLKTQKISRNWCISKGITRLGAIIQDLIKDGWKFDDRPSKDGKEILRGHTVKGDYVYYLVSHPKI